jgi:hypothetical protein
MGVRFAVVTHHDYGRNHSYGTAEDVATGRYPMWVVELNIAGIKIRRRARKRRHLLGPAFMAPRALVRPSGAA